MKYFGKLFLITILGLVLSSCGGGGNAACSVAVGGLACSGKSSGGGGAGSPTSTYSVIQSIPNSLSVTHSQQANLIEVNGIFYGTTQSGGTNTLGTVYSIDSNGVLKTIHNFGDDGVHDGASPFAGLTLGPDGNLYGTTVSGGDNGKGTVYEVSLAGGTASWVGVIVKFQGGLDGENPYSKLLLGADKNLYGTTFFGGTGVGIAGNGTVYKITLTGAGAQESVVHPFAGQGEGANPDANLIQDSAGNLYGTTTSAGENGLTQGTVFKLATNGNFTTLHTFGALPVGNNDGASPHSSLLLGADGNLYGTTDQGGANAKGIVFALSTSGLFYRVLYSFTGVGDDGANPNGNLVQVGGAIYGTTTTGGHYSDGTLYSLSVAGDVSVLSSAVTVKPIHPFGMPLPLSQNADGINPWAGLFLGNDGYFYAITVSGGNSSTGAIVKYYP